MKKYIIVLLLLFTSLVNSQTIVFEEKFIDNNFPVGYNFLPNRNRLVIQKGNYVASSTNKIIKNIYSFDNDGFFEKIIENEALTNCIFSPTENAFIVSETSKTQEKTDQFKLVINSKSSPFFKMNENFQYFNDDYEFSILNQDNKGNVNFEKDQLSLSVTDIVTRENEKFAMKKPDLARIIGDNFAKYNDLSFGIRVNEYNFGLITKAIAKDYKSATLYRTIYSYGGVILNDFAYKVDFQYKNLIYSNNGGGYIYTNPQSGDTYVSDLTINNFVIDQKTEEVYVYGLFGKNAKSSSNITNEPLGFYVFKFDKSGNKIWESVQTINDKSDFNANQNITNLKLSLTIRDEKMLLSITSPSEKKGYIQYSFINKITGNIIKLNKIGFNVFNENKASSSGKFINSVFNNIGYEKKALDSEGLIAQENNLLFSNYLNTIQNNQKLFFKTFYAKNGIWLLETDNTGYFKTSFFKE